MLILLSKLYIKQLGEKMKKSIIIGSLALFCNTLFAAPLPNIWTTGFGQGWLEYNISNENKQSLQLVVMLDMMMKQYS